MSDLVARHARVAELGGEPGLHSLARAYSRTVVLSRSGGHNQGGDDGGSVWADIYYALRAGGTAAAIRLALSATPPLQDFVRLAQTFERHVRARFFFTPLPFCSPQSMTHVLLNRATYRKSNRLSVGRSFTLPAIRIKEQSTCSSRAKCQTLCLPRSKPFRFSS